MNNVKPEPVDQWFENLRLKRESWVQASAANDFERGIWNAMVEKYADPSHFVFELLQNAEDAGATWVRFHLAADKIEFEHNGRPFDRGDIEGITGLGNTTKIDRANAIGAFGIGFKSVYVVTKRPEIHGHLEGVPIAMGIEDLVVPKPLPARHTRETTLIILPLLAERAETAIGHARRVLEKAGGRALLFLDSIASLSWTGQYGDGEIAVADDEDRRSISTKVGGVTVVERFLILSRPVVRPNDSKPYSVKAAIGLDEAGEIQPLQQPTKLSVFFETEESTGLRFVVHGPFQLTDNRANIKREDAWNRRLVEEIGQAVASALPSFRDRGLLRISALGMLPNGTDDIPAAFIAIRDSIIAEFDRTPLLPAAEGGHILKSSAVRGSAEMRALIGDAGLARFLGQASYRWLDGGSWRGGRPEAFVETLGVTEWSGNDMAVGLKRAFGHAWSDEMRAAKQEAFAWVASLDDADLQRFYLALDAVGKASRSFVSIGNFALVKLESGRWAKPGDTLLLPKDQGLSNDDAAGLPIVASALVRTGRGRAKEVEAFLIRYGTQVVEERHLIVAILKSTYASGSVRPARERHVQHLRRFVRWWKEHKDVGLFLNYSFVLGEDGEALHPPGMVFVGPPFSASSLAKIYDGGISGRNRTQLWQGYARVKNADLLPFLVACGVESALKIVRTSVSGHPEWSQLQQGFWSARNTGTGEDVDHRIPELDQMLARGDAEISRQIWKAMKDFGQSGAQATFSPNQSHTANRRASSVALQLRDAQWLPAKDGSLRRPSNMTTADLAEGLEPGGMDAWLQAIGLGAEEAAKAGKHKARREAAQLLGLPPSLADRLQGLPPATLEALSADVAQRLAKGHYQQIDFPERSSPDPERRASRLAQRAAAVTNVAYERRQRNVRTSAVDGKRSARTYLEDHYTNDQGQLVCQACHDEMPFRLPDGSPYFETPELLEELTQEHPENRLALCPTCSAKWQHANPTSDALLRAALADATSPWIETTLAGETVKLRFVQVHMDDIRTVAGITKPS